MMRAGYAVTRAAYRPLGLARKNSGRGGARSFAGSHAARGFAVAVVDDDRGHTRGRGAIDQAIGHPLLVAGPGAGDVDALIAGFECQVRNRGIAKALPRHIVVVAEGGENGTI